SSRVIDSTSGTPRSNHTGGRGEFSEELHTHRHIKPAAMTLRLPAESLHFWVFPLWGCGSHIWSGKVCWLLGFNPIRVEYVGWRSFQFVSLPGHTEGPWKHINFSFSQDWWGDIYLRVRAWGPDNTWCNRHSWCAAGNRRFAYWSWADLSWNIAFYAPFYGYW
ncbi:MAG: hypothetical protein JO362_11255, partial [Streptomycetaceae bacterium]|nr:hypothetical protein [Streptomycetaceae bacterium]